MLKSRLIESIEDLTLEIAATQIAKDREIEFYTISMIKAHKSILEGKQFDYFKDGFTPFTFEGCIKSGGNFNNLSQEDIKKTKKYNHNISSYLNHIAKQKYSFTPNHLTFEGDKPVINWNKFDLEDHVRFIKESISMLSTLSLDHKLFDGFWDGSHLVVESKNKKKTLLTEGSALGCPKQKYEYARKNFDDTVGMIEESLTKNGFFVEGIYDAGSLRRKKPIVGDLDFLVNIVGHKDVGIVKEGAFAERQFEDTYNWLFGNAIKKHLTEQYGKEVFQRKQIVQFENSRMQCDVFMSTPSSIHTRRCYWTGSAPFNAKMMYNGFKKNRLYAYDYIYDKNINKFLVPKSEEQIFECFGVDYVKPEDRV